jgi:type IV secretory pathway VirJ component
MATALIAYRRPIAAMRAAWALLFALVAGIAMIAGFLAYIGYLGGTVIAVTPATGSPLPSEQGTTVLFLSSDMGPRIGMGRSLVERFAATGMPVVSVNCLNYFRTERTADDAARLLDTAIDRALAVPGTRRLILVGQSFGADMLQASLASVAPKLRQRLVMTVLVVPPDTTLFRASPGEIFGFGETGSPAISTRRPIDSMPILCIQGAEETDSLCPLLRSTNVEKRVLPGGHMLDFDADRLFAAIAPRVRQTIAAAHYQ